MPRTRLRVTASHTLPQGRRNSLPSYWKDSTIPLPLQGVVVNTKPTKAPLASMARVLGLASFLIAIWVLLERLV
jgi:hypothetical protein